MGFAGLTVGAVVAALAGGVVGALLGALPTLGVTGITVVLGELAGEELFAEAVGPAGVFDPATAPLDAVGLTAAIGFGPVIGPHVAFAGGAGAAAYAGRKEAFDTEFRYHQAKQIAKPPSRSKGVALVGAAFGLFGLLVASLAVTASVPVDPVALSVVVSAFCHRLVFGYPLLGRLRGLDTSILDMSPFEKGHYWGDEDHDTAQGIAGRHVVEPWLPAYYGWDRTLAIGAGVGVGAGAIALLSESVFLAFGLAAAAVLAVPAGIYSIPVTYHVALPASIGALAVDGTPALGLVAALVFGVVAAFAGELTQRTLYAHADTHLDPAFASIVLTSLLLSVLATAGVLDATWIPYPVL